MDTTTIMTQRKNSKHNNINNVMEEHECNNSTKKGYISNMNEGYGCNNTKEMHETQQQWK
jgi:hypothetical protein